MTNRKTSKSRDRKPRKERAPLHRTNPSEVTLRNLVTGIEVEVPAELVAALAPEDVDGSQPGLVMDTKDGAVVVEYRNARGARAMARCPAVSVEEALRDGKTVLVDIGRMDASGHHVLHAMSPHGAPSDRVTPTTLNVSPATSPAAAEIIPEEPVRPGPEESRNLAVPVPMPGTVIAQRIRAMNEEQIRETQVPPAKDVDTDPSTAGPDPGSTVPTEELPDAVLVDGPVRVRDLVSGVEFDIPGRKMAALVPQDMVRTQKAELIELGNHGPVVDYLSMSGERLIGRLSAQPLGTVKLGQCVLLGFSNDLMPSGNMTMHAAEVLALPRMSASSRVVIEHVHGGHSETIMASTIVVACPSEMKADCRPVIVVARPQVLEVEFEHRRGWRVRRVLPRRQLLQLDAPVVMIERGEHDTLGRNILTVVRRRGTLKDAPPPAPTVSASQPMHAPPAASAASRTVEMLNCATGEHIQLEPGMDVLPAPRGIDLVRPAHLVGLEGRTATVEYETVSGRVVTTPLELCALSSVLAGKANCLVSGRAKDAAGRMVLHPVQCPGTGAAPSRSVLRPLLSVPVPTTGSEINVMDMVSSTTASADGSTLVVYAPVDMDVAVPAVLIGEGRSVATIEFTTRSGQVRRTGLAVVGLGDASPGSVVLVGVRDRTSSGNPVLHAVNVQPSEIAADGGRWADLRRREESYGPSEDAQQASQEPVRGVLGGGDAREYHPETIVSPVPPGGDGGAMPVQDDEDAPVVEIGETPSERELPVPGETQLEDTAGGGEEETEEETGIAPDVVFLSALDGGAAIEANSRRLVVLAPRDLNPSAPVSVSIDGTQATIRYGSRSGERAERFMPALPLEDLSTGTRVLIPTGQPDAEDDQFLVVRAMTVASAPA